MDIKPIAKLLAVKTQAKSAFQNHLAGSRRRNDASPLAYREAKLPGRRPQPEGRLRGFETRS